MDGSAHSSLAKLGPPRTFNAIERERLFRALDHTWNHPVVWVGAPAGAGKTTLISSYLNAREIDARWYQVDEGDKDPATLYHYLNELARCSKEDVRPRLSTEDLAAFSRLCFRRIYQNLGTGFTLVFDNCHRASGDAFHTVLRVACEELPPEARIIAISRALPPAGLARLVAHELVAEIGWSDLRLDENEAMQIARLRGESNRKRILEAYRLSDGWMIGLSIALASGTGSAGTSLQLTTREAVFDYLVHELLDSVPSRARKILMHCALLPNMSVSMARSITGQADADTLLEDLYRNQCLMSRTVGAEPRYRFHDLFREVLLAILMQDMSTSALDELRLQAAQLLEHDGQVNEAVALLHAANAWSEVTRVVRQYAVDLFYQGRWQTIEEWLAPLPEGTIARDPWLVYWRARALTTRDTRRARNALGIAFERFAAAGDHVGVFAAAMPLWETVTLLGEPWTAYTSWLPALERALAQSGRGSDDWLTIEGWEAYLLMSLLVWGRGALFDEARVVMLSTLADASRTCNERIAVANDAAILGWLSADVALTQRATRAIEAMILNEGDEQGRREISPLLRHWGHYWLALPSWCMGDAATAIASFKEAMELASRFRLATVDLSAYCYLSMAYHDIGRADKAAALLTEARSQLDTQRSFHWGMYHLALAFDAYRTEDLDKALLCQRDCVASLRRVGGLSMLAIGWAAEASYLCQSGRLDEAEAQCDAAGTALAGTIYRFTDAAFLFVRCEIARRRGDPSHAMDCLRRALNESRNPIKAGMLFSLTRCLPGLLQLAIDRGIEPDTTRLLIDRWNLGREVMRGDLHLWPVSVRTLGVFEIRVDGREVCAAGRPQFKVLALLKALIAAGGRHVSSRQLEEWLWPDAEGDASVGNLKVTMHRLRKLLGRDDALILHDGCISINESVCWVDIWRFESGSDDEGLALYQGRFLDQDDSPWALSTRERLSARFQRTALSIGNRYETGGKFDAAAQLYERCLRAEPYSEALYRQLMLTLKAAGRQTLALDVYRRCRRTLGPGLSRETISVYESLASRLSAGE